MTDKVVGVTKFVVGLAIGYKLIETTAPAATIDVMPPEPDVTLIVLDDKLTVQVIVY